MKLQAIAALCALLLSGCAGNDPAPAPDPTEPDDTLTITGVVQDDDVTPLEGAVVSIDVLGLNQTTGADGRFRFENLTQGFHVVRAAAPDHGESTLTVNPSNLRELLFVLPRIADEPYHLTTPFQGIIQCAAEYLIITPSCDSLTEELSNRGIPLPGGGSITDDTTQFNVLVERGWKTLVIDLAFDLDDHPGLEALRTVVSGTNDPNAVTEYEQYGRFHDAASYSFRIEPNGTYPEGVAAVPAEGTGFRFDVYGQGHGWHATEDIIALLGLGAAIDVQFELFVTAFYVEEAPEGWTILP